MINNYFLDGGFSDRKSSLNECWSVVWKFLVLFWCAIFRSWNSMMITRRCCPLHHWSHLHWLLIWPSSRLFQHLSKLKQNQKTTFLVNLLSDKGVPLCLETMATNHRPRLWTVWLRAKHYNYTLQRNTLWPFSFSRLKCIDVFAI